MDLLWICIGFGIDLYDLQLPHPTLHLICACACDAICVFGSIMGLQIHVMHPFGSSNFNTVNLYGFAMDLLWICYGFIWACC